MANNQNIRINIDLVGNASKAKAAINKVQSALNSLNTNKLGKGFNNTFSKLQNEVDKFETFSFKDSFSSGDIKSVSKTIENIVTLTNKLQSEIGTIDGKKIELIPDSELTQFNNIIKEIEKYKTTINDLENNINKANRKIQDERIKRDKAQANIDNKYKNKQVVSDEEYNKLQLAQEKAIAKAKEQEKQALNTWKKQSTSENEKAYDAAVEARIKAQHSMDNIVSQSQYNNDADVKKLREATIEIDRQTEAITKNVEAKRKTFSETKTSVYNNGLDTSNVKNIQDIERLASSSLDSKIDAVTNKFREMGAGISTVGAEASEAGPKIDSATEELNKMTYTAQQMSQLKNQVLSFFSVGNGIQLFKRMIRGAIDTITDLDAAMTETAVVTDFSVSDMWGRLREYTDLANKLGATTQGAYETMTLYYQQGLDTKATFELGEETMKMARIAGMDYSEATDMMTAALRGFNMELNQTSAQHINDVYSELAAITASDTYEISEAMTRTASIAASAGLDFDIASAYLAEAIETTREAPENIGTAMKTIVARFAGLTKDPSELSQDMQEALEGEVVEANRVEAALRAAGVQARDSNGEFRNLSDVFLELNEKWDSLDLMTQRYVATQAAGTRQQSRFIAMMQNYDRTMELVNATKNSKGASQKQFEKTLESMEAKVNNLKNAWNEFIMNIANSDMVKAGVDALTGFLTIINKISEAVATIVPGKGLDGVVKSLMNIGAIIGGMKIGGSILNGDLFRGSIGKGKSKRKTGVQGAADTIFQDKVGRRLKPNGYIDEGQQAGTAFTSGIEKAIAKVNFKTFKKTLRDSFTDITKDGDLVNGDLSKISDKFKDLPNSVKENLDKINFSQGLQNAFDASLKGVNLSESAKQKAIEFKKEIETYLRKGDIEGAINVASIRSTDLGGTGNINYANFGGQYSGLNTITKGLDSFSNKCTSSASALDDISQEMYAAGFDKTAIALQTFSSILFGLNGVIKGVEAATIALNAALMAEGGIKGFLTSKIGTGDKGWKGVKNIFDGGKFGSQSSKWFGKGGQLSSGFEAVAKSKETSGLVSIFSKLLSIVTKIPGPILAIGAAIGAAAGAWKIYDSKFSPEAKLEKATQAATQAQTVLNETQSAYNKLTEGKSNLDTLTEGFNGLVEGTTAWKEQMLDTNAAIIELGKQFPELLNYTETLSNGLMQISDEGWEKVLKKQQEALTNASAVSTIEAGRQAEAQSKVDAKTLKKEKGWATGAWTENDSKELNNILEQGTQTYLSSLETAMGTMVRSNDNVSNKYTEEVSRILSNQYEDMVDQQLSDLGSKKDIKKAWAKQNGWKWKEDDTYTNEATGAEQEFDFKTVKSQLADAKALDKAAQSAGRLSEELAKADAKTEGLFSKLMSKDISVEVQDLAKLQDTSNIEKMIDEYQSATSDDQFAQALADYLNVDIESVRDNIEKYKGELSSVLASNVDDIANAQKEQSKSLATLLLATIDKKGNKDIYKSVSEINKSDIANIESLISNLTTEQRNTFNRVATQIQENLGTDAMNTFLDATLNNPKITNTPENLQKINDAISDIDWSNPISAAGELSKYLESDNEVLQNFAEEMLNSGEACITAADQMQYFFNSNGWADLTEEVQDFIKTNGEVTADNVRELANENANLQQLMENTNTTATTMGLIMTELGHNGKFAVTSITDSLLALLSGFGKLDDTISTTISELEGFDPGIDEGAAADSLKSWTEAINGFWDNGEVGNSQLQNYLKKMFGQDQWQNALNEAGGDLVKAEEKLVKRAQVFAGDNMQAAWSDLANNKSAVNALEKVGISVKEGTDGVISLTDVGKNKITKTTDELVKAISEAYGVDSTTASAMIADFKNYSADFAKEVEAADITKSFDKEAFANSLKTSFVGADGALKQGQSILASDLKNTAQILKDSNVDTSKQVEYWTDALGAMGYTDDQIATFNIEAMVNSQDESAIDAFIERIKQETSKDHTFILDPKVDKNGQLDLKNLEKQLNDFSSSQKGWTKKFKNNFKLDNGAFDGLAMAKQLQSLGLTADQATQYITKLSDEGSQISIDGEIVDPADIESRLSTALDPLNDKSRYSGMAEAIAGAVAKALTELEITIDGNKITIKGKNPDGKEETATSNGEGSTEQKGQRGGRKPKPHERSGAARKYSPFANNKKTKDNKGSDKTPGQSRKRFSKGEQLRKLGYESGQAGAGGRGGWRKASTASTKKTKTSGSNKELSNVQKLSRAYNNLSAKEKNRLGLSNKINKNTGIQVTNTKKVANDTSKIAKGSKQVEASTKKSSKSKTVKTKAKVDTKNITKDINKAAKKSKAKTKVNVDSKDIKKQTSKAIQQSGKGKKVKVQTDTKSLDNAADKAKKVKVGKIKYKADTSALSKVKVPPKNATVNYSKIGKQVNPKKKSAKVNYTLGKQARPGDKTARVSYTGGNSTITVRVKGKAARGMNLTSFGSAAAGARRGKLGPTGTGGSTLTGEIGRELVWEPDTSNAYLVGTEGPEIVDLPGNAVVWSNKETEKILKGNSKNPVLGSEAKGNVFGSMATAYGGAAAKKVSTSVGSKSSSGSGGSKSSKSSSTSTNKKIAKTWENPYDEFYNLQRAINKEIRIREQLEKEYTRILKARNSTIKELTSNVKQQLGKLDTIMEDTSNYMYNKNLQATNYVKSSKARTFVYNNSKGNEKKGTISASTLRKYAWWDEESKTVQINWNKLNALESKKDTKESTYYQEFGAAIEDYISKLEQFQDDYEDAEDKYYDAVDAQTELLEEIAQNMFDAEEQVLDILVDVREKEIERLENINDSINDGNDRLMKSIQNSIDKIRRDRDNEKTEETLAEKERRLAYLKQDTSGRNALEIKQLEKELKDERESYKDTLVDQSIDDIQSSMDEASEQRERQIEILNKQLEVYQESGKAMIDVHKLMAEAINPDGSINESSNLFKLLEASGDYQAASNQKRDFLLGELVQAVKNYGTYLGTSSTLKDAVKEGLVKAGSQKTVTYEGKTYTGTVTNGGNFVGKTSTGEEIGIKGDKLAYDSTTGDTFIGTEPLNSSDIYNPSINGTEGDKTVTAPSVPTPTTTTPSKNTTTTSTKKGILSSLPNKRESDSFSKAERKSVQRGLNALVSAGIITGVNGKKKGSKLKVNGKIGSASKKQMKKLQKKIGVKGKSYTGRWNPATYSKFHSSKYYPAYKEGGLADFTGPAWLDGTKTRPEMVLNARDTENFIKLKDTLSSLMKTTSSSSINSNDIININIDVKEIANDYDVDQMINRVKKEITKAASNRNVNTISRRR